MNQELLKRVQKDCLEIMIDIDKVCRENNIDYSLCGGSVIGAMLYNGFIPWDDDIDIMMTRKNYEKFLKLYISKTTSNNKIINYKTVNVDEVPALFSRIVNPDVEVIEKRFNFFRKNLHLGLYKRIYNEKANSWLRNTGFLYSI